MIETIPIDVPCPACQAEAGSRCTEPTETGRTKIPGHHQARKEKARATSETETSGTIYDEYITAKECAEIAGIKSGTWSTYEQRGYAPRRALMIGNRPLWKREDILQWMTNRPGPGARTDLKQVR